MCWIHLYPKKHNIICVGYIYTPKYTNNVNKTRILRQTTGGKDELNIGFMRTSQHGTQNVKTHNRTSQTNKNEQHRSHQKTG